MFDGVKATLPLLDPKYAVNRIVDAVLKDQLQLVLPRFMYSMVFCKSILPTLSGNLKYCKLIIWILIKFFSQS